MPSSDVQMAFGANRAMPDGVNQYINETLTATTRRKLRGPRKGSNSLAIHAIVDAVTAPTSATGLTLWYSNLPDPSLASDADWVQDTTTSTVLALTTTGQAFINLTGNAALHYMLKADVTAGSVKLRVFARALGTDAP